MVEKALKKMTRAYPNGIRLCEESGLKTMGVVEERQRLLLIR
jgi:hypothetical protein